MDNELTQSARQTVKFFEEFVRRKSVADFIKKYREYLNIPPNGLAFTAEDENEFSEPLNTFFYIPKRAQQLFPKDEKEKPMKVVNTCSAIVKEQGLESTYIKIMLRLFLFFDQIIETPLKMFEASDDLLKLDYLPEELAWYSSEDPILLEYAYDHFVHISKTHPIVLYINPEVSQRQIQDFIAKNWAYIKVHEEKSPNSISGFRKKDKDKQDRNDFIYKNRNLPRKKIMKLVNDEFGELLDYGHIGKIISLEKKRRENK